MISIVGGRGNREEGSEREQGRNQGVVSWRRGAYQKWMKARDHETGVSFQLHCPELPSKDFPYK